jgi:intracellular sulfur oxidation DsrE/DsrF family protein
MPDSSDSLQRRSFLARFTAGAAAFGAAFGADSRIVGAQSPLSAVADWKPARHPQDDWFDELPGVHRFFFDTSLPAGAGEAITFASNFFVAIRNAYALQDKDLALIICFRHWSTPFADNDAIWAKYGDVLGERVKFVDPKTNAAPVINVYQSKEYGMSLPNRGTTLDALSARGVQFAVCDMATRALAGLVATAKGLKSEDVYNEFKANAVGNTHFVPAGIVAVNRAQERGYSLVQMS